MKALIISGGGVYGIIPCCLMACADKESLSKIDVFGGTSVGGILSLHLAKYGDPQLLKRDFKDNMDRFFTTSLRNKLDPFTPKYSADGIEAALQAILPGKVGDVPGKFVVPSFSFKRMSPVIFHNFTQQFAHMDAWKVARATSAAPLAFPPFSENIFIDGGILEKLPVITTASMVFQATGTRASDLEVFAIGTGRVDQDLTRTKEEVESYSVLGWAKNLMPILTTGGNELMSDFWGRNMGFKSFTHFNPIIIKGVMDDVSQIGTIEEMCELHLGDFKEKWDAFIGND